MTPEEIRSIRRHMGLTQEEAAHMIGVHPRTWRKWECDERSISPAVERLLGLMTRGLTEKQRRFIELNTVKEPA